MDKEKVILVVEDEAPLREAIVLQLKKLGVHAIVADCAEKAITLLDAGERPAIIWLDLLMPGMGGFAFLEKLRASEAYRDIPVAVVSVSASQEKIRRAFELNVIDYLVKSQYKISDLAERVAKLIV